MIDFSALMSRAVRSLEENTKEVRRSVYGCARTLLMDNLRSAKPALSELDVADHLAALEEAIRLVESQEFAREAASGTELTQRGGIGSKLSSNFDPGDHEAFSTAFKIIHHEIRRQLRADREKAGPTKDSQSLAQGARARAVRLSLEAEPTVEIEEPIITPNCIFVSYRRDESAGFAGRIFDRLITSFSRDQIFMDVDNIEPGLDFVEVLNQRVGACEALLAVIGPNWITSTAADGSRRLDDPHDFVRIEIEAALRRDIRTIPILIAGSPMPRPEQLPEAMKALTRRQAFEVSHASFNRDVEGLIAALRRVIKLSR